MMNKSISCHKKYGIQVRRTRILLHYNIILDMKKINEGYYKLKEVYLKHDCLVENPPLKYDALCKRHLHPAIFFLKIVPHMGFWRGGCLIQAL